MALATDLGMDEYATQSVLATFVDYWRGVPGNRGVKLDWQATFRNWLRRNQAEKGRGDGKRRSSITDNFAKVRATIDELERREIAGGGEGGAENIIELSRLRPGGT
jgi:hypothetical protein